jgi:hypothetical protein
MRKRLLLSLLVLLLTACAPAETSTAPPESAAATSAVAETTPTAPVDLTPTQVATESLTSATPPPTVQAIATSRGPKLEATDPQTVSMASGGLQFVEFFEFW